MNRPVPSRQARPRQSALRPDAVGVSGILFFVFSAQAPLTGIVGAAALAIALGNGSGAPGAYLVVGLIIIVFAIGFTTFTRHVDSRGGFFAILRAGLGRRAGNGGAFLALLSYNTIQAAMYGLFGATLSALLEHTVGVMIPWWVGAGLAMLLVWLLGSQQLEIGARILAVLVIAEVLVLLAFAVVVLFSTPLAATDISSSFSPGAIASGAPGVAVTFAIASMFGFESTAIYSSEAKDAHRTVPRATYIAVVSIAVFFAFVMWMLVTFYGADRVQARALESLATDPASFVLEPLRTVLGPWASTGTEVLLCTSLFAGLLAFHNMVTRYLHAMARDSILPASWASTNARQAPARASQVQTVVAVALVAPFALLSLDPLTSLFAWFSGVAVAALLVLYVLTSCAIVHYFHRRPLERSTWRTKASPVISIVLMLGELALIVANFPTLTGSSILVGCVLLAAVPLVFIVGWALPVHDRASLQDVRSEDARTALISNEDTRA